MSNRIAAIVIIARANRLGLAVEEGRPGDGHRRYKFIEQQAPHRAVSHVFKGPAGAEEFLDGYAAGRLAGRKS